MKFEVKNRWTGDVQFEAKITCDKDTHTNLKMGLAVRWAVENYANLRGADLGCADLGCADLGCANLGGADLGCADLRCADLGGADLGGANLRWADLGGAYLRGADLGGADLRGTDLGGADLGGANLRGAKWSGGFIITKAPIKISGLDWKVNILDTHMEIGCEIHSHEDWANFTDKQIIEMDGRCAARFWKEHKATLLALCASHAPEKQARQAA